MRMRGQWSRMTLHRQIENRSTETLWWEEYNETRRHRHRALLRQANSYKGDTLSSLRTQQHTINLQQWSSTYLSTFPKYIYTHIQYGLFTNIVSSWLRPTQLLVKSIIRFVDSLLDYSICRLFDLSICRFVSVYKSSIRGYTRFRPSPILYIFFGFSPTINMSST